jgi:hypothetical protein
MLFFVQYRTPNAAELMFSQPRAAQKLPRLSDSRTNLIRVTVS